MRELVCEIRAFVGSISDLSKTQRDLLMAAQIVRRKAYAPYSHYLVGATVLATSGEQYSGCNVERASYTQTTHAEQNAIDTMVAVEGRSARVRAVAVVCAPESERITAYAPPSARRFIISDVPAPCGNCLQDLVEHALGPEMEIILLNSSGEVFVTTLRDALPMPFKL